MGKIYTLGGAGPWSGSYAIGFNGSTAGQVRGNDMNASGFPERSQFQLVENTWYHFVWIRNGAGITLANTAFYLNGISSGAGPNAGTQAGGIRTDSLPFCIGKDADSGSGAGNFWAGQIGETQISSGIRDTNWIRLSYKNQGFADSLIAFGAVVTTVTAPVAPTLSTPANASVGASVTPTLTWGTVSGAVLYHLQVSSVSTFASTVVDDSAITAGTKAITGLVNNTTYYWRVNAKNIGGTSAWSGIFSFKTTPTGVIAATPHYVPSTMGHNGVLEVYMVNGSRVMQIAYEASATKTQLLNKASKTLAKGYYTYRFRGINANVEIVGKLIK